MADAIGRVLLRPYQQEALAGIERAAALGGRRVLLALPRGTGKTIVFAALLARRGSRGLVLVHREELLEQSIAKIQIAAPDTSIGVVKAARDDINAAIVVATVQTLSRSARLHRLRPDFTTIVVDEAHHATAESYRHRAESPAAAAGRPSLPICVATTYSETAADDMYQERLLVTALEMPPPPHAA
jgi:superfamily II DNA or RNA helicase